MGGEVHPRAAVGLLVVAAGLATGGGAPRAGTFVNFESPHTRPIVLGPEIGGSPRLFVVNTPDDRVSIIDTLTLELLGEVPVGLEPVSLAVRPGTVEVWVANHLSDTVDVIHPGRRVVTSTIPVGDEPAAIAFTPDGARAYVSLSQRDAVAVVDARTRSVLQLLSLATPPSFNTQDPRALAVDRTGAFVYVLPFESGNRTRGQAPADPGQPGTIVEDPELSDVDLFAIRTSDNAIVGRAERLGTILTNIAVSPDNSRLYVTGWEARNLVRGVENLGGHPTVNQLTIVDRATLGVLRRVDLDGPVYARPFAVAQPSDLVFDGEGRLWVAAQGNDEVVILDAGGEQLGRLPAGRGPRGLAFDPGRNRLYVFNRLSHDVTVIDTAADQVVARVPIGYDPTPDAVREGRVFLYSAEPSGDGSQACVSCHADGHHDNLTWDVGSAADPKGPMFTQSLRGLKDNAPYHWRGERATLRDFNVAFEDLFHGRRLPDEDNDRLARYLETIQYPPNPNLNRDGSFSTTLARCGMQLFMGQAPVDCPPPGPQEKRQFFPCVACHTPPHGSNHRIVPGEILVTHDDFEVTQLRGLFDKLRFLHDGRDRSIADVLSHRPPFPPFPAVDRQALQEALLQFATAEHHASVGIERTANRSACPGGALNAEISGTLAFLEQQARLGRVDLTVAGTMRPFGAVQLLYDPVENRYLLDQQEPESVAREDMVAAACAGTANLTFTAWSLGTGVRARDRDEDGVLNGVEVSLGTDPANRDSDGDGLVDGDELRRGTAPTDPDTDGDTVGDGREVEEGTNPLDPGSWLRFVAVDKPTADAAGLTWSTVFSRRYAIEALDRDRAPRPGDAFEVLYTTPVAETESPEGTERYVDVGLPPSGWCRFYQARVVP
jgi:YVTN family beta-propeller protein